MGLFRAVWCTLLLIWVWAAGVLAFAQTIDSYHLPEDATAQGIVVLTGGGGRVEHGLELLATGRGEALFISGVSKEVPMADLINKAPIAFRALLDSATGGNITLGHQASNTIGNAQESIDWIRKKGFKSVFLVTADYHMPRAIAEFETGLSSDVKLIPAPVKTREYGDLAWLKEPQTRNLVLTEFHKLIAAKLRHWFIQLTKKS